MCGFVVAAAAAGWDCFEKQTFLVKTERKLFFFFVDQQQRTQERKMTDMGDMGIPAQKNTPSFLPEKATPQRHNGSKRKRKNHREWWRQFEDRTVQRKGVPNKLAGRVWDRRRRKIPKGKYQAQKESLVFIKYITTNHQQLGTITILHTAQKESLLFIKYITPTTNNLVP